MKAMIPNETGPYHVVLLFGPPGSGKGTLGKFLSSAGNHYHLSSGDIFRGLSPESAAGKIFHTFASQGKLVPDEVTVEIFLHYVSGLIATNSYFPHEQLLLLDGLPRTVEQRKLLDKHIIVDHIISLEMPNIEGLITRLKRRALIERRMDDFDEKVLQTRMRVYTEQTEQVLDLYEDKFITRFNADQPPLDVLRDVLVSLSTLLSKNNY